MTLRDSTFRQFGPILLEASVMVILEFQNELRQEQGKPLLTMNDVLQKLQNHVNSLEPYDWME